MMTEEILVIEPEKSPLGDISAQPVDNRHDWARDELKEIAMLIPEKDRVTVVIRK